MSNVSSIDSGGMWMTSNRPRRSRSRRSVARDVAAGQDEAVAAGGKSVEEIVEHAAQAGEALERAQLEELVEQERRRFAVRRAGAREKGERRVERRPGARSRRFEAGERRRRTDRLVKPLGRRRRPLDVDELRRGAADPLVQLLQQRRPAAAAAAEQHRNARRRGVERGEQPARDSGARRQHARLRCGTMVT